MIKDQIDLGLPASGASCNGCGQDMEAEEYLYVAMRLLKKHGWAEIPESAKDGSRQLIAWVSLDNKWMYSFARYDKRTNHFALEDRDAVVGARYYMPLQEPEELPK